MPFFKLRTLKNGIGWQKGLRKKSVERASDNEPNIRIDESIILLCGIVLGVLIYNLIGSRLLHQLGAF